MYREWINECLKFPFRKFTAVVDVASAPFIAANADRIALIIPPPLTNAYTVSTDETAVAGQGFVMQAAGGVLILTACEVGMLLQQKFTAIGAVGPQTIMGWEVYRDAR